MISVQIPQIWAEYLPVEVEEARFRRINSIRTNIADKKVAAAAARKLKAAATTAKKLAESQAAQAQNTRPQRTRQQTTKARVSKTIQIPIS